MECSSVIRENVVNCCHRSYLQLVQKSEKMASNKDLEFDFEMLLLDLEKGRKKGKNFIILNVSFSPNFSNQLEQ